nr:hypothetical protein [Candidatus Sigynarchaeota archaeon]
MGYRTVIVRGYRYNCASCSTNTFIDEKYLDKMKCPGCGRHICGSCRNQNGCCKACYSTLPPETRRRIQALGKQVLARRLPFAIFCGLSIFGLAGFQLFFTLGYGIGFPLWAGVTLPSMILALCFIAMFCNAPIKVGEARHAVVESVFSPPSQFSTGAMIARDATTTYPGSKKAMIDTSRLRIFDRFKPVDFKGQALNLLADLAPEQLKYFSANWYLGLDQQGFADHFTKSVVAPKVQQIGPTMAISLFLCLVQDMVNLLYNFDDKIGDNLSIAESAQELVDFAMIDPALAVPYLTFEGTTLRTAVLEINPTFLGVIRGMKTR